MTFGHFRCFLVIGMLLRAIPAAAQAEPAKLATMFRDIFGPNGLIVNSEQVLPDGSTHSAHFNSGFQSEFTQFNIALASQLTSLPLPSPASGFTYTFDQATGTFVRSTQSFGPILAERSETIGRGRMSAGYNLQYFGFDSVEGLSLGRIPAVFTHDDAELGGGRTDIVATTNTVEATVSQMTGVFTYGVTDRIDLSVALPLIRTTLHVQSRARIERLGTGSANAIHFFRDENVLGGYGRDREFVAGGGASGIGDLILRVKGNVLRHPSRGLALGLDVRVPSGDEENLLGTGAPGAKPFAALSFSAGRLSPHVNLGYQWNGSSILAGDLATGTKGDLPDQVLYAVGADYGVSPRLSLAVDLLGRVAIDSPRLVPRTFSVTGDAASGTFQDIGFVRETFSLLDGSAGMKVNLWRRVLINFNLRFSITDSGLSDRITPLIGIEIGS
jgi:Putative MetA-pathway of phenol degradation